MKSIRFDFQDLAQLSKSDKAYTAQVAELRPFFNHPPNLDSFEKMIKERELKPIDRTVLVDVLREQYSTLSAEDKVAQNIESLLDLTTFTITTAHQPSLFTGPLYFIYKSLSAINWAEALTSKYPKCNFVPIFILGSEDHDFEEINHVNLFGKTLTWENEEEGATGTMSTATLTPVLGELKTILGESEKATHLYGIIEDCYTKYATYAEATAAFVNELFKEYGLVVLRPNHAKLKRLFIPIMEEELTKQSSENLVNKTIGELSELGFKTQATPRNINLFYLKNQRRDRIVFEDDIYKILNTNLTFSKENLLTELHTHPEYFSPNVIMRPLYQETILPNLAYIGGGGELAYWLERKAQFEHFGVLFPILIRRHSALWLDSGTTKRLEKLGLMEVDLWQDTEVLIKQFVGNQSDIEIDLSEERKAMDALFESIAEKSASIDANLKKGILADKVKQVKLVGQWESRLVRAEKKKHDTAIRQIRTLKEKLYPKNGLQERHDNLLAFYVKYGDEFIATVKEHLVAGDKRFVVIRD